nr:MurR/RpiR family transcriptional regulator [Alkalibaculum bacchi]
MQVNIVSEYKNFTEIMLKIKEDYPNLSKGNKRIADFILNKYEKAAFMTAASLGEAVGVSEATVVRFANYLGFNGYPRFKKVLQEMIKTKLTTTQRIDMSLDKFDEEHLLNDILTADIDNIRYTLDEFDKDRFQKVIDLIVNAQTVYIVGFRTTSLLTEFLGYYLDLLLNQVKVIDSKVGDIYEQIIHAKPGDVVIGISFPRYSSKTYESMKFLKERGLKVVAITDNEMSPITRISDYYLIAKSNIISFVDTITAPMSLMNAIIVAVGLRNREKTKEIFNELEEIWAEHYIYDNSQS